MSTTHNTVSAALRQTADIIAEHPGLPIPYVVTGSWGTELNWFVHLDHRDLAEQKAVAAEIVRTLGGDWTKDPGDTFSFRQIRGAVKLNVQVERPAVCERIVVGAETRTIPAVAAQPERTETVEKVEWRCQPLLADDTSVGALQHESHDLSTVEA